MALMITNENVEQEINKSTLPVILDVYATWCGPCQQMAPIFEELEKELGSKCKFLKLNVDEAREISIQYGITSVPTFVFIKNGEIKHKETGYMNKNDLRSKIENFIE
ncbi:MAG: thioredoxin [Proteobacteria bacterium]|jgi:thioredoxin 1|nr:thioredoxin [Pseudomonadota bacterium]NBP14080.1 thioredoxin [bacterium]